ncbi:MAG: ion channel [Planctomycetota bacterium]
MPVFLTGSPPTWVLLIHSSYHLLLFMLIAGFTTQRHLAISCGLIIGLGNVPRLIYGTENPYLESVASGSAATSAMIVLVLSVRRFLSVSDVSTATISKAMCMYILLGITFALLYYTVDIGLPDSFQASSGAATRGDLYYFSFVTMTTLGYGDIIPISSISRSLALAQALLGQVFIAVVIGRLVSIHVGKS